METEGIASRLKQLINFLELSDSQFADRCGISRATLSLLLSGKNKKISDVMLSQIHEAFPNVSIMWLLFKEGNIETTQSPSSINGNNPSQGELFFSENEPDLFTGYRGGSFSDEKFNENSISQASDTEGENNSNLTGLKNFENKLQEAINKGFERYFKNYFNNGDLDNLSEKNRKIRQITVYYDDSTFETFSPGK